ncbi:MAG: sigma-70 family RNA polymerase sigma factor [Planctomycetota bacterium]|nr:sigma-70 family RNA polymerase sigma factor [Planctomycetota bacterium]
MPDPRPLRPAAGMVTRASLLSRIRGGGDAAAWGEFEARYRDLIYRFCTRRGLQHADAEDCAQAVLVNLFKAMQSFRYDPAKGTFRSYIYRCTRGVLSRMNEKSGPVSSRAVLDVDMADMNTWPAAAANDDLAQLWEQEWVAHHMRRAMETVRASVEPRTMSIFEASLSGRTAGEVALEFAMSEAAVQKIRQRIRERLEAAVAEQVAEEEQLHA